MHFQIWNQNGKVDLFVRTASSVDDVTVARGNALVDNGIQTGQRSARVTRHAPESVGGASEQGRGGREGCDGLHGCGVCCSTEFVYGFGPKVKVAQGDSERSAAARTSK